MFRAAKTLLQSLIRVYEGGIYSLYKKEEEEKSFVPKRASTPTPYHCRNCKRVVSIRDLTQADGTHLATMSIVYNAEIRNGDQVDSTQKATPEKRCKSCMRIPTPFCPKSLRQCVSTNNLTNFETNRGYNKTTEELQTSIIQLSDRSTSTTTLEKRAENAAPSKKNTNSETVLSPHYIDSSSEDDKKEATAFDVPPDSKVMDPAQRVEKNTPQADSSTSTSGDELLLGKHEKRSTETSTDDFKDDATTSKSCETDSQESIVGKIEKSGRKTSASKSHKESNQHHANRCHKRAHSRKRSYKTEKCEENDASPERSKTRKSSSSNSIRRRRKRKKKRMKDSNETKTKRRKPQLCDAGTHTPQMVDGSTSTTTLVNEKKNSSAQMSASQSMDHQTAQSGYVCSRDSENGRHQHTHRTCCGDEPSLPFRSRSLTTNNISILHPDMNIVPCTGTEDNPEVIFLRQLCPEPRNTETPQIINLHENRNYTRSEHGFSFPNRTSPSFSVQQIPNLWFPTTFQTVPNFTEHAPLADWRSYAPKSPTPNYSLASTTPNLFLSTHPYGRISFPFFQASHTIPQDPIPRRSNRKYRKSASHSTRTHSRHRSSSKYQSGSDEESSYEIPHRSLHRRIREKTRRERNCDSRDRSSSRDEKSYRETSRSRSRMSRSRPDSRQGSRSRKPSHERSVTVLDGPLEQVRNRQMIPASPVDECPKVDECHQLMFNSSCVESLQLPPEEWQFNYIYWQEAEETSRSPTPDASQQDL